MTRSTSIRNLTLLAVGSVLILCITLLVQQSYRHAANDPQLMVADFLASHPDKPVPPDTVDLERSLSVFAMRCDAEKHLLVSDALLHGKVPEIPDGVLDYALKQGKDVVSWQPEAGVRIALVVQRAEDGSLVAVGRSLQTAEERESQVYATGGIFWTGMALLIMLSWFLQFRAEKRK